MDCGFSHFRTHSPTASALKIPKGRKYPPEKASPKRTPEIKQSVKRTAGYLEKGKVYVSLPLTVV